MEELLDRLITLDFGRRGIAGLYEAARDRERGSLVAAARDFLLSIPRQSRVLVTTGSVTRSWVSPSIAETDGPPGTAALCRLLSRGLEVTPVLVCEETLIPSMEVALRAAGLVPVTLEQAFQAEERRTAGPTHVVALCSFPADDEAAKAEAAPFLERIKPSAMIAVERAGMNVKGVYHNMRGYDYSAGRARIDYIFSLGSNHGIPSLAVGDGGNEIGMGAIAHAVKESVPYGDVCNCPCGAGLGAMVATDKLVVAAVSNWGCYAMVAAAAVKLWRSELMHSPEAERRILEAITVAGMVDGNRGWTEPTVDGLSLEMNLAMTQLIVETALLGS